MASAPSTRRWAVHPPPLPDETLTSWLVRVARANGSSLASWLAAELGRASVHSDMNLEADDCPLWPMIAERTALPGGVEALREMSRCAAPPTATRWLLPDGHRARRRRHRFCPRCLLDDPQPYFRRAWRFGWLVWCPRDGTRLREECPHCDAMLLFHRVPWGRPITDCWRCERSLLDGIRKGSPPPAIVQRVTDEALDRIYGLPSESLETLWCLQKFVRLFNGRARPTSCPHRWRELLAVLSPSVRSMEQHFPKTGGEVEAFSFVIAWHIFTAQPDIVPALARTFQGRFNQATFFHCPATLAPLRRVARPARPTPTEGRVSAAVAELVAAGRPVHCAAVAQVLGVDPKVVATRPALRAIVDRAAPPAVGRKPDRRRARLGRYRVQVRWLKEVRAKLAAARDRLGAHGARISRAALAADAGLSVACVARFERLTGERLAVLPRDTYPARVRAAIAALQARGERVSTVAVARELGRARTLIEGRPDLKAIVRAAKAPKLTEAMVSAAIGAVAARGERVTTLGVSRELKRGRDQIEREPTLLALVKAARRRQRDGIATRVRSAVADLRRRGVPVTFRAVAAAIGKDEHFFERAGQKPLRPIVATAKARP